MNLAGIRFGKLVAKKLGPPKVFSTTKIVRWYCQCDCGNLSLVYANKLRNGATKSCGCIKASQTPNLKHGYCVNEKVRPEYWSWHNAKRRCYEKSHPKYPLYGGRGISMYEPWKQSFAEFVAHMGPCPAGHTLDRINNDGNYEPGNVRWATKSQQAYNRRKKGTAER